MDSRAPGELSAALALEESLQGLSPSERVAELALRWFVAKKRRQAHRSLYNKLLLAISDLNKFQKSQRRRRLSPWPPNVIPINKFRRK